MIDRSADERARRPGAGVPGGPRPLELGDRVAEAARPLRRAHRDPSLNPAARPRGYAGTVTHPGRSHVAPVARPSTDHRRVAAGLLAAALTAVAGLVASPTLRLVVPVFAVVAPIVAAVWDARAFVSRVESRGSSGAVEAVARKVDRQGGQAIAVASLAGRYDYPLRFGNGWALSGDTAVVLVQELVRLRPRVVMEVGSGVSTVLVASELKRLGSRQDRVVRARADWVPDTQRHLAAAGVSDLATVTPPRSVPPRSTAAPTSGTSCRPSSRTGQRGPADRGRAAPVGGRGRLPALPRRCRCSRSSSRTARWSSSTTATARASSRWSTRGSRPGRAGPGGTSTRSRARSCWSAAPEPRPQLRSGGQRLTERYFLTESGMKIARMTTTQQDRHQHRLLGRQARGPEPRSTRFGLPHSSRSAAVSVLIGFHSATGRSKSGRVARRHEHVRDERDREDHREDTCWPTSTVGTDRPSQTPTQDIAKANSSSRPTPARNSDDAGVDAPADGEAGEHQHDQDAGVVDDVGEGRGR